MRILLCLCTFIFLSSSIEAQVNVKDSSLNIPMLYITYAYQFNDGDIAKRFGNNSAIGGGFQVKTKKNWIIGAEYNYLFAGKIIDEASILSLISTSDGNIIGSTGEYAEINFLQAGNHITLKFGKVFKVLNPNPNSGIMLTLQPGFIQHRIKIVDPQNIAPQISGDYRYGYDEKASGFSFTEFIGYLYMGNKRLFSFYGGIEFTQGFTKFRRAYNFNTMSRDTEQKHDYFYSLRVGWIIPLYKRKATGYYY